MTFIPLGVAPILATVLLLLHPSFNLTILKPNLIFEVTFLRGSETYKHICLNRISFCLQIGLRRGDLLVSAPPGGWDEFH